MMFMATLIIISFTISRKRVYGLRYVIRVNGAAIRSSTFKKVDITELAEVVKKAKIRISFIKKLDVSKVVILYFNIIYN